MTATYTFDVFSSLDGYSSYEAPGNWGGYWGKQGPELIARREELCGSDVRMVFGANTFRDFVEMLGADDPDSGVGDSWVGKMRSKPTIVISSTLKEPLNWPDARVVSGDAVEIVRRLKDESDVPLRSHGSLSLNAALMAAGLVDRVQVTIFSVVTGESGARPVFEHAADFDLELIENRVLDGRSQELIYQPTLRSWPAS